MIRYVFMWKKLFIFIMILFPTLCLGTNHSPPEKDFLTQMFTFDNVLFLHEDIQMEFSEVLSAIDSLYSYY